MTNTREDLILKRELLAACTAKQQSLINDFTSRIKNLLETNGLGNEEAYDNSELSNAAVQMQEVSALNEALDFAQEEMKQLKVLEAFEDRVHTHAEPGSVVVTNRATFFISVSIEQFQVSNKTYIGLSVHSPVFLAMKGKERGETFNYNGVSYRINNIF